MINYTYILTKTEPTNEMKHPGRKKTINLRGQTKGNKIRPKHFTPIETNNDKLPPEKKPLFLIMQKVWFDEILSGKKKIEYRDYSPFYCSRFLKNGSFRNYSTVVMQVGYNANAQRMTVEVEKIILDDGFEIHLGEIIEKNF